jgi:ribulose-5-phosphate 4-epimerase/fuculose-1-phosphate aldolase
MIAQLGDKNAIQLRGYGNVVLGGSVEEAVVRAVFLDESARLQYQARCLGEAEVLFFEPDEVQTHGTALLRPDRIQRAWDNWLKLATSGRHLSPVTNVP